ncbi:flagellar protein FlgP [Vibrio sp. qd031]|jgi:hypothetical protein|uniref:LPP20 family lipoprotein n=1 Tax=Vibrio ulleungensis TaxID=2807619 RepID=A0ABS2HHR6_9VIBR|nr:MULTISPECIES: LPP20 family lipoprotein [Vibrio]MBM7036626.1 LPP20 family lipoprotein [Vibrio ulleungensis]ORT50295.1 flagellar protein FlgP [Vibrio sp. qd031]
MRNWIFCLVALVLVGCQPLNATRQGEVLTAVGYSSITDQSGRDSQEKQIKAMRASKLDAYRELAEQIYGMRISGRSDVQNQRLYDEETFGAVDGVVRGAEVVRTYTVGDSYVTELRLDINKMDMLRDYGEVQHVPAKRQQTLF